jgi:hypothetical protein
MLGLPLKRAEEADEQSVVDKERKQMKKRKLHRTR